mmetsp:Transcript_7874/g.12197  ORF Transcript_7874/g.12197 Transcript_7874/m.12197 type:complete len:116 (-) Transcript_7874:1202-1549(-)
MALRLGTLELLAVVILAIMLQLLLVLLATVLLQACQSSLCRTRWVNELPTEMLGSLVELVLDFVVGAVFSLVLSVRLRLDDGALVHFFSRTETHAPRLGKRVRVRSTDGLGSLLT